MKNVTESELTGARNVLREFIKYFEKNGYSLDIIQMFNAVETSLVLDEKGRIKRTPYVPGIRAKAKPPLSHDPEERCYIPSQDYVDGTGKNPGGPIYYPSSGEDSASPSMTPSMGGSIFDDWYGKK